MNYRELLEQNNDAGLGVLRRDQLAVDFISSDVLEANSIVLGADLYNEILSASTLLNDRNTDNDTCLLIDLDQAEFYSQSNPNIASLQNSLFGFEQNISSDFIAIPLSLSLIHI